MHMYALNFAVLINKGGSTRTLTTEKATGYASSSALRASAAAVAQEGTFPKPDIHDDTGTCKIASDILAKVGDKWSILVVACLSERAYRFNELRRIIGNISQKMLSQTLRNLERDGFVSRKVTDSTPPGVIYDLTDFGHEFAETAVGLAKWAATNSDRIVEAQQRYDRRKK